MGEMGKLLLNYFLENSCKKEGGQSLTFSSKTLWERITHDA